MPASTRRRFSLVCCVWLYAAGHQGPQYANRIGDLLEDVFNGNQVVATEATHIMEDSTKPRRQSSVVSTSLSGSRPTLWNVPNRHDIGRWHGAT